MSVVVLTRLATEKNNTKYFDNPTTAKDLNYIFLNIN